jgi:serine protease Do
MLAEWLRFCQLHTMRSSITSCLIAGLISGSVLAETVKDREGAVRKDRETMQNDARWKYNNVEAGFEEAKKTGKPVLVVLRCVPCMSCIGMDAAVLSDTSLEPLLDQFVCVRLINANAIDLALFQFDYDLSFSTMFFNADGTVYGRYGSWTHQKDPYNKTLDGYKRALEGAIALHKGYPANKAALAGKQGAPMPFRTPVEIPMLAAKYQRDLNWETKVVGSCVHCHMIGDAFRTWYREQGKPVPVEWIHPMPSPESIGLTLATDQVALVDAVAAGSAAEKAAFKQGDEIVSFAGQPLTSMTDVSWVLHRTPDSATLPAIVKRDGAEQKLSVTLPTGWRNKTESSKRVGFWSMRGMATGGMVLEDLPDEERTKRGLNTSQLALFVKGVGQWGKHAAAKNAGFQKDDVIVEIDGITKRTTESGFIDHCLAHKMIGTKVKAIVLRGDKRVELMLPMQ